MHHYLSNAHSLCRHGKLEAFQQGVKEYLDMDHAEAVPPADMRKPPNLSYYLPMHGVIKTSSTTTKLRIVFDASTKTGSGYSLNDILLLGPSLYPLLTTIITRFHLYWVAILGDISKMFREVSLHSSDYDMHRFLHRDETGVIRDFLNQEADIWSHNITLPCESSPSPTSQKPCCRLLSSCSHSSRTVSTWTTTSPIPPPRLRPRRWCEELNELLGKGLMMLHKWRSSSPELLDCILADLHETSDLHIILAPDSCGKALGIHWSTAIDCLHITKLDVSRTEPITQAVCVQHYSQDIPCIGVFFSCTSSCYVDIPGTMEGWRLLGQTSVRQSAAEVETLVHRHSLSHQPPYPTTSGQR